MVEMATYLPRSEQAFFTIYGVGRYKMEKYASHFLPLIGAYCRENELAERPKPG
ncbi:MAG: HRDC domain-containing protein [Candidatus Promineifilaceae bacterium]